MDVFWHGDHLIKADVGSTLVAINEKLKRRQWKGASEDWIRKLRDRDNVIGRRNAEKMQEKPADGNINPLKLLGTLDEVGHPIDLIN